MLKHMWSVLCERISIDRHSNLCSYLSCIEAITTSSLPAVIQNLSFGCRWNKSGESKETLRLKLTVISPDGKEIPLIESAESVIEGKNHRVNFILNGMSFKQNGIYTFRLKRHVGNKWSKVQDIPLNVFLKDADKESVGSDKKNKKKKVKTPKKIK